MSGSIRHGSAKLRPVQLGPAELIQLRHRLVQDVDGCGPGCAGEAAQSCDYRLLLALLDGYEAQAKELEELRRKVLNAGR